MSLASAYGPSVMVLLLPLTSLPARSSGCPRSLMWPLSASCFIQAIQVCMLFCICSGDPIAARLAASVLRYRNTNSLMAPPGLAVPSLNDFTRAGACLCRPARRTDARGARRPRGAAGTRAVRDVLPRRRPERRRTGRRLSAFLLVREGGGRVPGGGRGGFKLRHGFLGASDEPVAPALDPAILRGSAGRHRRDRSRRRSGHHGAQARLSGGDPRLLRRLRRDRPPIAARPLCAGDGQRAAAEPVGPRGCDPLRAPPYRGQ